MIADIIAVVLFILLAIYGYKKGVVLSLINLAFIIVYALFADQILSSVLGISHNTDFKYEVMNNMMFKYIAIVVVGIVLIFIINFILKRFLNVTGLSFIDKLLGFVVYGFVAYAIICLVSLVVVGSSQIIDYPWAHGSYLFSSQFNPYNLIRMWFGG